MNLFFVVVLGLGFVAIGGVIWLAARLDKRYQKQSDSQGKQGPRNNRAIQFLIAKILFIVIGLIVAGVGATQGIRPLVLVGMGMVAIGMIAR